MRKPIDPNLNGRSNDNLFEVTGAETVKANEPEFKVTEKEGVAKTVNSQNKTGAKPSEKSAESGEHKSSSGSSHHHHSSSGSSHHHSSSGGSHHHSSGSSRHHSSHSSSHSHHSHSSKKKKLPTTAKIAIGIIAAILLAIAVAVSAFFVFRHMGKKDMMPEASDTGYQETIEYKGHTYKYNTDIIALGFLGVDQRTFETVDNTDFVGAADADIVAAIDTKTGKTKVIAIPRDTMIDIDIYSPESGVLLRTQKAQLCLAYSYGDGATKSCESTIDAMSRILYNVPIRKYFSLNLEGIAPLNDAIGGVKLTSISDFPDQGFNKGQEVTLLGDKAEAYVRTRSMTDLEASLDRTKRQVQYVKAYSAQVLPAVVKDFSTVNKLYGTARDYSQTNISLGNTTYLASLLLQKGVTDFETYTIEGKMKSRADTLMPGVVHAEFYPDEDSVMQTVLDVFYTKVK